MSKATRTSLLRQEQTALTENDPPLSVEQLKAVLPKRVRHNVTPKFVEELNELIEDPDERQAFRENLLSYTKVLENPQLKLSTYIGAVRYISYKLMGHSNLESWIKAFPERYERLIRQGKDGKHIRAVVTMYNKGKTVNALMEQTMVPTWVLNQDLYQKALNTQAELMMTARSEKVRSDAANSLLTHLKQPEATKMTLDVNVKEDETVKELRTAMLELARQQRLMVQSGAMNAKEIAESRIIPGEYTRND